MLNQAQAVHQLPLQGFVRICQIVGSKSKGIPAILPIGKTSFLNGVKSGKYPKPVKLGERTTAWRVEDIRTLIERLGENHPVATPTNSSLTQKTETKSTRTAVIGGDCLFSSTLGNDWHDELNKDGI